MGRLAEALEAGKRATELEPKRFEALVITGDAADGLEAYPVAAQSYRRAIATIIDSRAKHGLRAAGSDAKAGGGESARVAAARRAEQLRRLHAAFRAFELKGKAGFMDASDTVLLCDALGVPASSAALQVLRDLVAEKNTQKRGSILGGARRAKNEVRLRDLEDWWLAHGSAAATDTAGAGQTVMADLDGSAGTGALMTYAPDELPAAAREALEEVDLSGLYLKLGTAYYRALLTRDEKVLESEGGAGTDVAGAAEAPRALAAYTKPTKQGGPAFAA